MRLLLFAVVSTILFVSCSGNDSDGQNDSVALENKEINYKDYFYPSDSLIPYIYVFQGTHNPLDEKFFRIYRLQDNEDTSLVVERYNAQFRITEGFTHNLKDSLKLSDYMVVDGDGLKRKANVLSDRTFPLGINDVSYFVADFPSPQDSITMIYESKRTVADVHLRKEVLGDTVDAIRLIDSLRVHLVNPFTKQTNSRLVVTNRYYAKGFGLVEWGSDELDVHYRLTKIFSDDWWLEFAQGPQVKM